MKKWIFLIATTFLLVTSTASYAALLWPLEVGQKWLFEETDNNNNVRVLDFTVTSVIALNSTIFGISSVEDYFHIIGNYTGFADTYIRSTENAVYGFSDGLDGDAFYTEIGKNHWVGPTEQFWYLGIEDGISVPYGGPYTAHVWEGDDIPGDPNHFWRNYLVPGVGLVLDVSSNDRVELLNVVMTPIPGSVLILLTGLGIIFLNRCVRRRYVY